MKSGKYAAFVLSAAVCLSIAACGGGTAEYNDGTYEGQSSVYINEEEDSDDGNGYGIVVITIEDGAVTGCEFTTYEPDGTLKDENYGMKSGGVANRDYYNKAQKALAACDVYEEQFISSGSVKDIDAVSGATINYNSFVEAVEDALKKAEK